jgi:hypothetical protein
MYWSEMKGIEARPQCTSLLAAEKDAQRVAARSSPHHMSQGNPCTTMFPLQLTVSISIPNLKSHVDEKLWILC